ncbi:hypothetical protein Nepgr_033723 [Nepenthes gracilis]|uniref:Uncharacterized protein n=1 Tax=Nepenthes gracilis TaxID=150966 RepID=A0AAD3TMK0_NEPGR|nr:hypothetical protein Nepgr_033723 [Nepenthes gracilis]
MSERWRSGRCDWLAASRVQLVLIDGGVSCWCHADARYCGFSPGFRAMLRGASNGVGLLIRSVELDDGWDSNVDLDHADSLEWLLIGLLIPLRESRAGALLPGSLRWMPWPMYLVHHMEQGRLWLAWSFVLENVGV